MELNRREWFGVVPLTPALGGEVTYFRLKRHNALSSVRAPRLPAKARIAYQVDPVGKKVRLFWETETPVKEKTLFYEEVPMGPGVSATVETQVHVALLSVVVWVPILTSYRVRLNPARDPKQEREASRSPFGWKTPAPVVLNTAWPATNMQIHLAHRLDGDLQLLLSVETLSDDANAFVSTYVQEELKPFQQPVSRIPSPASDPGKVMVGARQIVGVMSLALRALADSRIKTLEWNVDQGLLPSPNPRAVMEITHRAPQYVFFILNAFPGATFKASAVTLAITKVPDDGVPLTEAMDRFMTHAEALARPGDTVKLTFRQADEEEEVAESDDDDEATEDDDLPSPLPLSPAVKPDDPKLVAEMDELFHSDEEDEALKDLGKQWSTEGGNDPLDLDPELQPLHFYQAAPVSAPWEADSDDDSDDIARQVDLTLALAGPAEQLLSEVGLLPQTSGRNSWKDLLDDLPVVPLQNNPKRSRQRTQLMRLGWRVYT